jgi:diaminopimelate epimerase
MRREIEVYRMSGSGNLFSVIDNRIYGFTDVDLIKLAVDLCSINDNNAFRAEGLLVLSSDTDNDFDVKFMNPDGSTGMMCGNGGRCAVDFAVFRKISKSRGEVHKFSMAGNIYYGELSDEGVKLTLPSPIKIETNKVVELRSFKVTGTYVDVASDHFVVDFNQLYGTDAEFNPNSINKFAPSIRYNQAFGLAGVNVNIYRKVGDITYLITYERGVEKVTGACGTGAISTAIHQYLIEKSKLPIVIMPPSSIPIIVDFELDYSGNIKKIFLTGHSEIISKDLVKI